VGIGTTSPTDMLDVAGTIAAQQIKVEASVPDYVFEPSYHLQPLSEVKQFVEEHHHLPDIPSAAEVKDKGLNIGEMQAKLLGKVEELTLHMIQAEERNNRLEERNDLLEKQVQTLQERLAQLAPAIGSTSNK
jgi:predicted nuclease with TOPRIM domain